jgi:transposase
MPTSGTTNCADCAALREEVAALKAELARLQADLAKAQKHSGNSSKPPSSDIVKPPRPHRSKRKRKRGGQPGHPRHEREPFPPEQVDDVVDYTLSCCPDCGGPVHERDEPPRIIQQVELVTKPVVITEHRGLVYECRRCQVTHCGAIAAPVRRAGLLGPRLTTLIAFLKGACHCSFSTIRKFLRDVVGVSISRGHLAKQIAKVSAGLEDVHAQLLQLLPHEERLNVDETGHKDNGQGLWTWCFRAPLFTLFKIAPTRSADVLIEVLGTEFDGVLGCDYFSAYHRFMGECNVSLQFCLAHLIRDVKFLTTHPEPRTRAYGERVLAELRRLFGVIHRRDQLQPVRFAKALEDAGCDLWMTAIRRVPNTSEAQNLANRFLKHGESYIRFITTPGIEPTNNLAEQAIRFVVLDRHVTQGSRGETGQRWLERIWTTIATCTQQGRSVFDFLAESIVAHFTGAPPPTLVPNST